MAITAFQANELVTRANVNSRLTEVDTKFTEIDGKFPVSIANGGTGGTTATGARTNLEVLKEYSLYSDDNGTQSPVILSDSIYNYSKIRVYYRDDNWCMDSALVPSVPAGTREIVLQTSSVSIGGKLYVKSVQIQLNNTNITWHSNHKGVFWFENNKAVYSDTSTNSIYIMQVSGYKY